MLRKLTFVALATLGLVACDNAPTEAGFTAQDRAMLVETRKVAEDARNQAAAAAADAAQSRAAAAQAAAEAQAAGQRAGKMFQQSQGK